VTSHSRRGVTLIELLIAMIVASILGGALLTLMMAMNRFEEREEGLRGARRAGRSALNSLASDLRMVDPEWGIEAATATSITLRIPYAMGLTCASTATLQTIMLMPVDSVALVQAGLSGYASRGSGGVMTANTTTLALTFSGSVPAACTTAGMQTIAAGNGETNAITRPITLGGSGMTVVSAGTPVLLYRRVRYYFGASAQSGIAGRNALWRDWLDDGAGATELAGPFDATAAFRFYNTSATTAQTAVPSPLTNVYGIELFLPGESDRTARKRTAPEQANLTTSVFFMNRRV
jgi:prepilin-type N-terminal cleavage/methylation domain-containing protein